MALHLSACGTHEAYKDYLIDLYTNPEFVGDIPPIDIYVTSDRNPVVDALGNLYLPFDAVLTAYDGETQLEARFLAAIQMPESLEWRFACIIHYNRPVEDVRQFLHDRNAKGMRISPAALSTFDHIGALSVVINQALEKAGIDADDVQTKGNQLGKSYTVSHQQCRAFGEGYLKGRDALTRSASALVAELNRRPKVQKMTEAVDALATILEQLKSGSAPEIDDTTVQVWQCAGLKLG